jgi:acetyl esterase/lipase
MYIFENAARLSIDPQNIIFTGDSAGGYMAVEVWYRMLVRNSQFKANGIHLLYPALGGPLDTPR